MSKARWDWPSQRMQWWIRPGPEPLLGQDEALALPPDQVLDGHPHVAVDDLGVAAELRRSAPTGSSMVATSRTMSTPGASAGTTIIEQPW